MVWPRYTHILELDSEIDIDRLKMGQGKCYKKHQETPVFGVAVQPCKTSLQMFLHINSLGSMTQDVAPSGYGSGLEVCLDTCWTTLSDILLFSLYPKENAPNMAHVGGTNNDKSLDLGWF